MKRVVSLVLLLVLILGPLAACAKPDGEEQAAPSGSGEISAGTELGTPVPEETEDRRQTIPDDLPDVKFDGRTFCIATEERARFEPAAEELTGDITNDAIYNRNLAVSERFGVKLDTLTVEDAPNAAMKAVSSGTHDFDVVSLINYQSGGAIVKGVFHNWYDVPCVDLTKPWWSNLIVQNSTINGKAFTITGDLAVTALTFTIAMFFNQKVCENWGYSPDTLYGMVYEGEWTVDRLTSLVDEIYTDNNGNGVKDVDDTYGLGTNPIDAVDVWISALGQPVSGRDEEGFMTITLVDEKMVTVLEKMIALLHQSPGCCIAYPGLWAEREYLKSNLVAFSPLSFSECFGSLRDMEDPYGILPMPKFDENQEMYLTTLIDEVSMFGVMKTVLSSDLEFVGIVLTALNAESYRKVYPAYYDVALKNKYSEDPDTARMIDLVMEGRTFDLAFTFGVSYLNRFPYCVRELVQQGSTDIASRYAAMQKIIEKGVANINKAYRDE
jgi:hypothetical protein